MVALPVHQATDLPDVVSEASLDAEEDYWDAMARLLAMAPEPGTASRLLGEWVVAQDWWSGLGELVESDDDMFVVVGFGFVGMVLGPPYTAVPAFAIFDPLQLRRVDRDLRQAIADGLCSPRRLDDEQEQLDATLRILEARPWGDLKWTDITREEAEAEMAARRVDFLTRAPRIRSHPETQASMTANEISTTVHRL